MSRREVERLLQSPTKSAWVFPEEIPDVRQIREIFLDTPIPAEALELIPLQKAKNDNSADLATAFPVEVDGEDPETE
jgi:hypothetical protein